MSRHRLLSIYLSSSPTERKPKPFFYMKRGEKEDKGSMAAAVVDETGSAYSNLECYQQVGRFKA